MYYFVGLIIVINTAVNCINDWGVFFTQICMLTQCVTNCTFILSSSWGRTDNRSELATLLSSWINLKTSLSSSLLVSDPARTLLMNCNKKVANYVHIWSRYCIYWLSYLIMSDTYCLDVWSNVSCTSFQQRTCQTVCTWVLTLEKKKSAFMSSVGSGNTVPSI